MFRENKKSIPYKFKIISFFFISSFVLNTEAQKIRTVDNKGTINIVRNNTLTTASIAPPNPVENDIWHNNTTQILKIWDETNNVWLLLTKNAATINLSPTLDIDSDGTLEGTVQEAIEKLNILSYKGTTGSVFFADNDGTLTEDNDDLYWDNTYNRLYVGNSSLTGTNALNVGGTTRTSGLNNSNGSENLPSYRFTNDSNTGMYVSDTDELSFTSGGTNAITITSNQNIICHHFNTGSISDEIVVVDTNGELKKAPLNSLTPTIYAIGKHPDGSTNDETGYQSNLIRTGVGTYTVAFDIDIGTTNYAIQLTPEACNQNITCPNRQPTVMYNNITSSGFDIISGDGDNNHNDITPNDIGFMYTVIKLP